jgi:hypothetical protein
MRSLLITAFIFIFSCICSAQDELETSSVWGNGYNCDCSFFRSDFNKAFLRERYMRFEPDGTVWFSSNEDAIGEYSTFGPFFTISNPDMNTDIKGIVLFNWMHLEGWLHDNPPLWIEKGKGVKSTRVVAQIL